MTKSSGSIDPAFLTRQTFSYILAVALLALNWLLSAVVLWWVYGFRWLTKWGHYTHEYAFHQAAMMALIIAVLIGIVWLASIRYGAKDAAWRQARRVCVGSLAVLALYTIIVFTWRMHWEPEQGVNDYAMFLPIIGKVNASFFAEVGWIPFLLEVTPIMACISGLLYWSYASLTRRRLPKKS